ncbi:MAG: insulinase family protein, partial [Candidatus Aminicenantes bacterium]|nr:insulinase family protein [Candidatus Aminicenantes bacterium]
MLNGAALAEEKGIEKQFTLDNGMNVFLYERHNLPLVNIVAAVNAGSKDETAETNGLVHMLEHYILFRGTEVRSGSEVARDFRRHGAYFNAHTGQDLAIFEISLPAEYADFGLNNQRELLFNLKI